MAAADEHVENVHIRCWEICENINIIVTLLRHRVDSSMGKPALSTDDELRFP